jgi:hypothetical protein
MKDLRCGYAPERGRVASRGRWMDGDLPRQRETPAAGTTALRYGNRRVRNACESGAGAEPRQLTWEGARSEVQTESVRCPCQLALLLLLAPKYYYAILRKDTKVTWCRTPPPRWSHARGSVPCISVCDNVEPCDSGLLVLFFSKKKENNHTDANTRGLISLRTNAEKERT